MNTSHRTRLLGAAVATLVFVASAAATAQDMPVPKLYAGEAMQKGSWRIELLEMTGTGAPDRKPDGPQQFDMCMDSVMEMSKQQEKRGKSEPKSDCRHKLLKDTASEAIMESRCGKAVTTSEIQRLAAGRYQVKVDHTGPDGNSTMRMRYSYMGACKAGAGMISTDKNSQACREAKASIDGMDPKKLCAGSGAQQAMCEQQVAQARKSYESMCR